MEYISSSKNAQIVSFVKLVKDKKKRKQAKLFVCEGLKMLDEALHANVKIDTIIALENIELPKTSAKILRVPLHIIEKVADTKTPQGVVFSCEMQETDLLSLEKMTKILVLDQVRDPGNLGTIVRTAVSFGMDAIVQIGESADVTNPKVVRSTMGGIFKIPIIQTDVKSCFNHIKVPKFATYLDEKARNITEANLEKGAIILGNEAKGISSEVLENVDEKIIIPMINTESLNVSIAGSIAMWEMFKCQQ